MKITDIHKKIKHFCDLFKNFIILKKILKLNETILSVWIQQFNASFEHTFSVAC